MNQPLPIPNKNPFIADLVIAELVERKRIGIERYGVALQAHNGRHALQDLFEEILDAAVYCKQEIEQEKWENRQLEHIYALVAKHPLTEDEQNEIAALLQWILKKRGVLANAS